MSDFSHLDAKGQAQMVDVTDKPVTQRTAIAGGKVIMNTNTLQALTQGNNKKGDVIAVARLAGIQAAKKTADLIPLCHPLSLTKVTVEIVADESLPGLTVQATCKLAGRTGVEMEALTAVSVACLTIYDMCKAVDKDMQMTDICLLEKLGGRSGHYKKGAK